MTTLPTLARRLRDLGDVPLTAQALADAIDPPAEHWSEWLEWRGGPCPLPGDTIVQARLTDGINFGSTSGKAGNVKWTNVDGFRYRTPDPAGWLPRGKFIPPAELWDADCPVRVEARANGFDVGEVGSLPRSEWHHITHIRLVPRERKAELPEGFMIDEDGALWSEFGPVLNKRERERYAPAAIRQAVDAWLREMGDE